MNKQTEEDHQGFPTVYFRTHHRLTNSNFPIDIKEGELTAGEEEMIFMLFPKNISINDAEKGQKLSMRLNCTFFVMKSTDPNAYISLNGTRRIDIGTGVFSFPYGRLTFSTELTIFHKGPVKLEYIYVGALFRTYLESTDINFIVKASNQDTNNNEINNSEINNNDNIVLTLSNGCFWKKDLPKHPYNTEGIQELLDAKILFLTP
jgi:hypothetical protein